MIIIIVLKLDSSEVDPRLDSGHKLGWLLTQVNLRIKIVIIKPPGPGGKASSFKTRPEGRLRVKLDPLGPGHGSGWLNIRIKIIIIIVLKLDSGVDPRLIPGHGSRWSFTQINLRIKMIIIIILKLDSGVDLRLARLYQPCPSHDSGWLLTWVNVKIKIVIIITL
jgi:hypothetical protein